MSTKRYKIETSCPQCGCSAVTHLSKEEIKERYGDVANVDHVRPRPARARSPRRGALAGAGPSYPALVGSARRVALEHLAATGAEGLALEVDLLDVG